ncbi:uncharacterized protein LOC125074866 [Vanessa atalanta]|uniref:uncharacterized protein LOC125074866 n=1 Tax=Vanessa atalanta TaxID=42275 RepID=UPI001FCD5430|nr:uncharacterized protein LOC125074866 [Vanessa atalanta]
MWRSSKEEWERRKTYLIRSLFEDLPTLSPINESQEPTSLSQSDEIYRPESPLPELIIEKEPRKCIQDETEEFYNKLAKEMRRLYKKDFLNIDYDTSSCGSRYFESGEDNLIQQGTFVSENRTLVLDKSIREAKLCEGEYSQITSDETNQEVARSTSSYTVSTESEESIGHEEIVTKADVHTAVVKMSKRLLHERYSSKEWDNSSRSYLTKQSDVSSTTTSQQSYDTEVNETEAGQEVMKELAKTTEASPGSSSPRQDKNDQCTPEIIRRRQTIRSEYSLSHELPIWESNDKDIDESFGIDIAHTIASGSEMEIADSSPSDFNMYCTVTSTPKSLKKVSSPRARIIKRYRKRLVSYSTSSSGSTNGKRQAALQTSFSDDELTWKDLWKTFFVGVPAVYNICSCSNHVCS